MFFKRRSLLFPFTQGSSSGFVLKTQVLLNPVFVVKVSARILRLCSFIMSYSSDSQLAATSPISAKNRNHLQRSLLSTYSLRAETSPRLTRRSRTGHPEATLYPPPSHHKLGDLFAGQVQGKVLVGSLDGKRVLLVQHAGALIGETLIAAAVAQLLGAAKRVAVGGVLAELRPLQAVLLVEPDVVKRLAVPVGRRLRLPARRCLREESNKSDIIKTLQTFKNDKRLQLSIDLFLKKQEAVKS